MKRALFATFVGLSILAAAGPASAGAYVCNLPRALLCADCARDLTIELIANGACRVSFTPSNPDTPKTETLPLRFQVLTPGPRYWRPRHAAKPASASLGPSDRCFSFNGNKYCE
jgi:hypothetical protein